MSFPSVLLFGRTNVGKSTLFNRLTKTKTAVVYDRPGVTRDFLTATVDDLFQLTDSGGLFAPTDAFTQAIEARVTEALEKADAVVWVVDGRCGLTPTDLTLAEQLRKLKVPRILVINKVDRSEDEEDLAEFYKSGFEIVIPISAEHDRNIDVLKEAVVRALPKSEVCVVDVPIVAKFALIGRPNVGKSSLTNALLGEERALVSATAGTTRDAVECPFAWTFKTGQTERFKLIYTAGVRKKTSDSVEFYASVRTRAAMAEADIAVVLLDALTGPTALDKLLLNEVSTLGKGCLLVVNKWDLAREQLERDGEDIVKFQKKFLEALRKVCPFTDAPIVFLSAKTGDGLEVLLREIKALRKRLSTKLTTGALNRCLQALQLRQPPSADGGKRFKIYYAAQTGQMPMMIKVFCNRCAWMPTTYVRFLENGLRKTFPLAGCPVKWEWVEKPQKEVSETGKTAAGWAKRTVPRGKRVQNAPKDG
ncbi:MAG: ribosome biogenesis GTPase Der [Opitutales bacterium]|nr:ribosome biogenesis GTPase Der [Opitutales bacterium]